MKLNFLLGLLGSALVLAPLGLAQQPNKHTDPAQNYREADRGVQQAIAFQRAKDRADERQARMEARNPSVNYSNADRQMDDSSDANRVADPGPKVKK